MGDVYHGAFIAVQSVLQHFFGEHIQMVGRFVQHQQVCFGKHDFCQRNATFFAAAEGRNLFEYVILRKDKGCQHIADFPCGQSGVSIGNFIENGLVAV